MCTARGFCLLYTTPGLFDSVSVPCGICTLQTDDTMTLCNFTYEEMKGTKPKAIEPKPK